MADKELIPGNIVVMIINNHEFVVNHRADGLFYVEHRNENGECVESTIGFATRHRPVNICMRWFEAYVRESLS